MVTRAPYGVVSTWTTISATGLSAVVSPLAGAVSLTEIDARGSKFFEGDLAPRSTIAEASVTPPRTAHTSKTGAVSDQRARRGSLIDENTDFVSATLAFSSTMLGSSMSGSA